MHFDAIWHTTNPNNFECDSDSSINTAWPVACYCTDREQTEPFSWRKASMKFQFKKVRKETLQQDEGHLPLVPYCINQRNKCPFSYLSSLIDCTWTHSPQHPKKTALSWTLNNTVRLKCKQHLRKQSDMHSELQLIQQSKTIWKE